MAQSLNALAVGALVKDTGTLYNGKPIIWKIADKGHTGYPSGAVTLITERIISLKCFDAMEPSNSDSDRSDWRNDGGTDRPQCSHESVSDYFNCDTDCRTDRSRNRFI